MAAALASITENTTLFVHDLSAEEAQIKQQYGIAASPLRILSMRSQSWPNVLYRNSMSRFITFNSLVTFNLLTRSFWRKKSSTKVIFVRSRLERLYWGYLIPYIRSVHKKWIFVYEAHDVAGIRPPEAVLNGNPFCEGGGKRHQRALRSMINFDLIICVTKSLADNLRDWSHGMLNPYVVRHASAVPRIEQFQAPKFNDKVVLGYIGTIDLVRGSDILIDVMSELPRHFSLRLVGRIPGKHGDDLPSWLKKRFDTIKTDGRIKFVPPIPVNKVAQEIDRCDILLQPASDDVISLQYRAPLKLFDYMVRGKPIIAADVPCHKEMLQDGVNACLYRHGEVEHLASCIQSIVNFPDKAKGIAREAWEQSVDYTYHSRARRILELIESIVTHAQC